ncbi:hypothetical protein FHU41_000138 [Psychromicrobium silvestre]|uniref:Lipoprotein n=1 Tax=Psychromicrobium silvestre TaxID=1645614 RepID=A0A7Y9LQV1_9MICC|nr:hypothetical protein [Psychromicrobium silvestre]NYE93917.1 hypothetical protein [Psychromicrobium silvestre]
MSGLFALNGMPDRHREPASPRGRCKTRATSGTGLALVGVLVFLATSLVGCTTSSVDPGYPFDGTRSAKVVFQDFLDTMDDIVKHSGTTFADWDRQDVTGYVAEGCGVRNQEDGRLYGRQIVGGRVVNPDLAVQQMKAYWESKGYVIESIFTNMGGNTTGRQINATSPTGVSVQFTPGKTRSTINVQSDCTLDPLANETTTKIIP